MTSRFAAVLTLSLIACSGGTSPAGDDTPMPDGGRTDGSITTTLDPNDCTGVAASFVAAAQQCGTSLPANAQATIEAMCRKGIIKADLCGGDPAGGLACFETQDATDWVCAAGEPYPYCNNDLGSALGMYCLISLGNASCASGIHCQYDVDCSNGMACNSATNECFAKDAYCVGLPCAYDVDCPSGQTCNSAEGACIVQ